MLAQQRSTLAFGHASPDPELHTIVERIRTALELNRAMTADGCRLALRCAPHEQLIRIHFPAPGPGHPSKSCFVLYGRSCRFCHYDPLSEAQY
jgi:hypothetical protein